jgi:Txe/YoeB family toxin of Txe-Axe toxin-antitoxin module
VPFKVLLLPAAEEDCKYWEAKKPERLEKIKDLLRAIEIDPFKGIGHPEPLKQMNLL